jgi:hypothetical protein
MDEGDGDMDLPEEFADTSTLPEEPIGLEETIDAKASSSESNMTASSEGYKFGNRDYVSLAYTDKDPANGGKPLVMVAGIRASFPARMTFAADREAVLRENIEFMVTPSLPEGLTLHDKDGLISGIPVSAGGPSMHRVTVSIDALGPNGVFLGKFPLASCTISIHIVDLQNCVLSPEDANEAGNNSGRIVLQWQIESALI